MKNIFNTIKNISKTHKLLVISFTIFFLFSVTIRVFATPPTSPYQAGNTLDPTCAPGDTNCFVEIIASQTGNSGKFLTTDGTSTSWDTITTTQAIGDSITNATEGSILFAGSGGTFAQDNSNFFWDDTNNRLGIGTSSPQDFLHLYNPTSGDISILLESNSGNATQSFKSGANSTNGKVFQIVNASDAFMLRSRLDNFGNPYGDGLMGSGTFYRAIKNLTNGRVNYQAWGIDGTEALTLDTSANLGVGINTPGAKLHVYGGAYSSVLADVSDSTFAKIWLGAGINATNSGYIGYDEGGNERLVLNSGYSASHIEFRIEDTEKVRIDSSGNVGIGTASPSARLHVTGSGATSGTTSFLVENSSSTESFKITDDNIVRATYLGVGGGTSTNNIGSTHIAQFGNAVSSGDQYVVIDSVSGSKRGFKFGNQGTIRMSLLQDGTDLKIGSYVSSFVPYTTFEYATGNVGIGTESPSIKLEIKQDAAASAYTSDQGLRLTSSSSTAGLQLYYNDTFGGGVFQSVIPNISWLPSFINPQGDKHVSLGNSLSGAGVSVGFLTAPSAKLHTKAGSASDIVSIFQGTTSQTGNLTEWRNVSDTVLSSVDASGNIHLDNGGYVYGDTTSQYLRLSNSAGTILAYNSSNYISHGGRFDVVSGGISSFSVRSSKVTSVAPVYIGGFDTTPSAQLHVVKTTEQLRLGYDASNYWTNTIGASGALTMQGVGTGGSLTLSPTSGQNLNVSLATTGDFAVNTNQFYVDTSSGNVGIGTSSPGYLLDVNTTARVKNNLILGSTGYDSAQLSFARGSTGSIMSQIYQSVSTTYFDNLQGSGIDFRVATGGTYTHAFVRGTGFGVQGADSAGSFTLSAALHVKGASDTSSDFAFKAQNSSGGELFAVRDDGNIGIGTASPSAKLHTKATSASDIVGIFQGTTSQTGNLLEARLTNNDKLFEVTPTGVNFLSSSYTTNQGGIAIKYYQADNGGWSNQIISGTNPAVWTSGKGIYFANHSESIIVSSPTNFTADLAVPGRIWLGGNAYDGTKPSVIVSSTGNYVDFMGMKYASSPYPTVRNSALSHQFYAKSDAAWADGSGLSGTYGTKVMDITQSLLTIATNISLTAVQPHISSPRSTILLGDESGGGYFFYQYSSANVYIGAGSAANFSFSGTGNVAIGNSSPSYKLQVGSSSVSGIVARFENSTGTCDINPTTTSLSCSSDINLKKNITTLDGTDFILNIDSEIQYSTNLDKLLALNVVTYNWNTEDDNTTKHIGFIAQQVESIYPDLVTTDINTGLKSLNITNMIPYTIAGIQQINVTLTGMQNLDESSSFVSNLRAWFASASNGIMEIFVKKVRTQNLCVSDENGFETCITKSQLDYLLSGAGASSNQNNNPPPQDPPQESPQEDVNTDEDTPTDEETIIIDENDTPTEEPEDTPQEETPVNDTVDTPVDQS